MKNFAIPEDEIVNLIPTSAGCLATDQIVVDFQKVGYMYRERPSNPNDSGWRFFSGNESEAYMSDLSNSGVYSLNTIANYYPEIIPFLEKDYPCSFERSTESGSIIQVD